MTAITRTFTFTDSNLKGSQVESELQNFAQFWNNHDQGVLGWKKLYTGRSSAVTGEIALFNSSNANKLSFIPGVTSADTQYTLPTAFPAGTYVLQSTSSGVMSWLNIAGTYAPLGSAFVTIGSDATLSAERALTGTANQITITDNGANGTVVLSTPQNIHTGATPTFAGLTLSGALNMGSNKVTSLANGTASSDAAAFGQIKFIQAVQGTSSGGSGSTSSTFTALGPTVSITPTSASNRIKITVIGTMEMDTANKQAQATLTRGGTNLGGSAGFVTLNSGITNLLSPMCIVYIDSPATTASVTYDVRFRNTDNSTNLQFGQSNQTAVIIAEEIV